jgi:hypothetical protein
VIVDRLEPAQHGVIDSDYDGRYLK